MPVTTPAGGDVAAVHVPGGQWREFEEGRAGIDQLRRCGRAAAACRAPDASGAPPREPPRATCADFSRRSATSARIAADVGAKVVAAGVELEWMTDTQKPPVSSHFSICGRRSAPQKGSPSTMIQGAPKTPAAIAASVSALQRVLDRLVRRQRRRQRSPDRRPARRRCRAPSPARRCRGPRQSRRGRRMGEVPGQRAVLAVQPVVGARRLLRGERESASACGRGYPWKRAERAKSRGA